MTSDTIWTSTDVSKATGGQLSGVPEQWRATGISMDSRTTNKGDLFIALVSDAGDGHDYVAQAFERGAVAAIVSHKSEALDGDAPLVLVKDTMEAMKDMADAARSRTGARIIAVTGSVGKTGTKEMLGHAFSAQGQTHYSRSSYNNHIGVPFSLASMHAGSDYGVFEIGMNHPGEIVPLTAQVQPDIAIITTIAEVHAEHFTGLQQIADAKAEIFDGMKSEQGIAILNKDNEWFDYLKGKAEDKGLQVLSFGTDKSADARLVDCLVASNGNRVTAEIMGEIISFPMKMAGQHIALNAIAALLAVKMAGGDLAKAYKALGDIQPIAGRGKREYLDIGDPKNPVTLIDESYNASPVAMQAAFKVLALIDPGRGGRRIAVLGDMLELGSKSAQFHKDLALPAQAADVNLVYTCGQFMKGLYDELPANRQGAHKDTSQDLAQIVPDVLVPGDVVMVKGSLGSKMGVVVEALRKLPSQYNEKSGNTGSGSGKDDLHAV